PPRRDRTGRRGPGAAARAAADGAALGRSGAGAGRAGLIAAGRDHAMRHVVAIAVVVLALVAAAEAAPPSNVGYRKLEIHDTVTGELYPVALWYPTLAAPAPLFLTASLSPCGLPAILCRLMAFELPVAADAAAAGGASG